MRLHLLKYCLFSRIEFNYMFENPNDVVDNDEDDGDGDDDGNVHLFIWC